MNELALPFDPPSIDPSRYPAHARFALRLLARMKHGRLDVVVVNAGVGYTVPAGKGRFDLIKKTIDTDLTGAIATVEQALPLLRAQGGGQIVGITSIAGVRGVPMMGAYAASKAGLHRYLQAVRAEVRGEPITVTELAPGYIDTDMNRGMKNRPFVIPVERGAAIMAKQGVRTETIRAADHDTATGVWPDMTQYGAATDAWPWLYEKVLAADICSTTPASTPTTGVPAGA